MQHRVPLAYNEAMEIASALREHFARRHQGLAAVWLFGSVARGTDTARSDVDVGVLYAPERPREMDRSPYDFRLENDLEEILRRPVQVVVMNGAPPDLVHRILRDGELIFEGNRSRRIRFEIQARSEYLDLLPVLQQYRRRAIDLAIQERSG